MGLESLLRPILRIDLKSQRYTHEISPKSEYHAKRKRELSRLHLHNRGPCGRKMPSIQDRQHQTALQGSHETLPCFHGGELGLKDPSGFMKWASPVQITWNFSDRPSHPRREKILAMLGHPAEEPLRLGELRAALISDFLGYKSNSRLLSCWQRGLIEPCLPFWASSFAFFVCGAEETAL